jgi:hypothetical protein
LWGCHLDGGTDPEISSSGVKVIYYKYLYKLDIKYYKKIIVVYPKNQRHQYWQIICVVNVSSYFKDVMGLARKCNLYE